MVDDRTALLQGIAARPEEDLPRLVYADWLEEQDDLAQAEFIRAQVEAANLPPWEPFAVYCQHRRPEWFTGKPWRAKLPELNPIVAEWPEQPFRRGLPWSLIVRQLTSFLDIAADLFQLWPIGQLHLPTGTLQEWERFAQQPWLNRVESIHFYGLESPIEPIRELCRHARSSRIREIVFEQSNRPAIPALVEALLQSPLERQIRSLEFRVGPNHAEDLLEALTVGQPQLERLAFRTCQFQESDLERLAQSGLLTSLRELEWDNCLFPTAAASELLASIPFTQMQRLSLIRDRLDGFDFNKLRQSQSMATLRALDLTLSTVPYDSWSAILLNPIWANLRSLKARSTGLMCQRYDGYYSTLSCANFWDSLVELDLRDRTTCLMSLGLLQESPPPAELTSLRVSRPTNGISLGDILTEFRLQFGDALEVEL